MKPTILVVGSTNTDMVIKAGHLPAPGETILGGSFFMFQGGKGANQAVAAKRLGGDITFIAKTGNDIFGQRSVQLFKEEGIDTGRMLVDDTEPSGVALITVDDKGENCIVVASGANAALTSSDLELSNALISEAGIVLMQLEIPLDTVRYVAAVAAAYSRTVILNPAPACWLDPPLLHNISIITPNKKEAEMLTGIGITDMESTAAAARALRQMGVRTVIITLGSQGAYICSADIEELVSAPAVQAIDTTAAGDVFNGALAVALSEGQSLTDAVTFGCKAAAISVTRLGAQSAAPFRHEVELIAFKPS